MPGELTWFIYCVQCSLCHLFYVGETGRRFGDRIREPLYDTLKIDYFTESFSFFLILLLSGYL